MLDYCIEQARRLDVQQYRNCRLWAVVTDKRGNIIGEACNSYKKTHPYQAKIAKSVGMPDRQFLHAEASACIRALRASSEPYKIYVARVLRNGEPALACPCRVCNAIIKETGITVVEYTV